MKTAMQELKSDLILTKEITLNSFSAIKNQEIKDACIKVVEMTLNSIITRIDTELLAMEKEQIIAFGKKCFYKGFEKAENDDANCFTAWREEANELLTFKSE